MERLTMWHRVKRSLRGCRFRPSLRLCLFEEEFCLDLVGFLIALPFMDSQVRHPRDAMESWGCYYYESSLAFCWGNSVAFLHMPWQWDHCKHEVRNADGQYVPFVGSWEDKSPDGREALQLPYRYVLKSGEIQNVIATVHVERRTWKWRGLRSLPWPKRVKQSIAVQFDGEIGEKAGSWKGGVVACGWEMKPGETPEQALRRMEAERSFH